MKEFAPAARLEKDELQVIALEAGSGRERAGESAERGHAKRGALRDLFVPQLVAFGVAPFDPEHWESVRKHQTDSAEIVGQLAQTRLRCCRLVDAHGIEPSARVEQKIPRASTGAIIANEFNFADGDAARLGPKQSLCRLRRTEREPLIFRQHIAGA